MSYEGDLRAAVTQIRDTLERVEKLLERLPVPCDGKHEDDGAPCVLSASHSGWHEDESGRRWLDH